jgi:hypothetical protein
VKGIEKPSVILGLNLMTRTEKVVPAGAIASIADHRVIGFTQ